MRRPLCLRPYDYQGTTCIQRMAGGWCGAEDLCQECTCRFMGASRRVVIVEPRVHRTSGWCVMTGWFAVLISAEEAPDVCGPFRSNEYAHRVAEAWNADHPDPEDRAWVVPMIPAKLLWTES